MPRKKKKPDEQRDFIVGLQGIYRFPTKKRSKKAVAFLRKFVFKHFRVQSSNVVISNKLNEFLWQFGREHIPKKVEILVKVSEGKAFVFLKGEKVKLPKEEKKPVKKEEEKEKTEEEKAAEAEAERKREEKKIAEKAAEKAAMKRGKD